MAEEEIEDTPEDSDEEEEEGLPEADLDLSDGVEYRSPSSDRNTTNLAPPHKRHRIAMVCDFFWPSLGGVENHIWSLSQQLLRRGHHVIVITHAYGQRYCRQGVRYLPGPLKVYYCPLALLPGGLGVTVPTFSATLPLLRYIFLREAITVVHGHQATSTLASEAMVWAATLGLRSVYTDHSLFGLSNDLASVALNRVLQVSLATVDAAICVSHTCRDNFVLRTQWQEDEDASPQQRLQLPLSERVRVIANAVHPTQFTPLPARTLSQSQGNRWVLVGTTDLPFLSLIL
jgi:phosphatidylinositol glycan class A protein